MAASLAVALVVAAVPTAATAAAIKGTVRLPAEFTPTKAFDVPVFWVVPNSVLPPAPPLVDPRRWMVVTLDSAATKAAPPKSAAATIVMEDSRFMPPVLAVTPNTRVTFVNRDGLMHLLEPVEGKFMAARAVAHGDLLRHTFEKAGTYHVHCSEVPHMVATVLVTEQALATSPSDDGSFRFDDVPPGKHTLKIWYGGKWIHSQPVRVRGKTSVEVRLPNSASE